MPNPGDVVYIDWAIAKKPKFLICIDPNPGLYMVINSKAWDGCPQAQLQVTVADLPCLDHVSHINTAQLVRVSEVEIAQVENAPHRNKGPISAVLREGIKSLVSEHGILPQDQEQLVVDGL